MHPRLLRCVRVLALAALTASPFVSSVARADAEFDAAFPKRRPLVALKPSPQERWYGWQTLLVDVGDVPLFFVMGPLPYLLGAPIVHFAHGRVGTGFGDLGMRLGLPVAFGFVAYSVGNKHCSSRGSYQVFCSQADSAAVGGAVVGMVTAIGLDAAFLAHETVEPKASTAARRSPPAFRVAPDLQLGKSRSTLGLRGSF
ncbi:MAG: uncharacterized protein JWM74_1149 [Myxococcaceae bacterium]|nr:uncharacterized protein [Myxococcaceae bacterium]